MKKFFVKALAVLLVCLFAISGINFSIIADDSADAGTAGPGEQLVAMNIAIRGKINLMFYFRNVRDIAYFKVGLPQADGTTSTVKISKSWLQYDETKDRYELRVPVAAALLAQDVTVQAFDNDGNAGKLYTYSIKDYANKLFAINENGQYDLAVNTLRAMLNYGAMAQAFFLGKNNDVENPNDGLYYRGTNPVDEMTREDMHGIVSTEAANYSGDSIRFTSVNAYLDDMVSLRFYFDYTGTVCDTPEHLTVKIDGETYKNEVICDEQGNHYVLINNIPATHFNKQYTVRIEESGSSYAEISYSVFNYLQARFEITDEKQFADVAYSMFQFYAWTNEFAGTKGIIPTPADCAHGRTHVAITSLAGAETLETATICSDCGATLDAATVGKFTHDNGTVTTESLKYSISVSGGNGYGIDNEYGITGIDKGETLTIGILQNSKDDIGSQTHRFHLDYYASSPVEITMNYPEGGTESYYLEAGENIFSAVIYLTAHDAATTITVEPLTDTVDFILFSYETEEFDVNALGLTTDDKGCSVKRITNGRYTLGINLTWGGAISELYDNQASDPEVKGKNLVNNFDVGRLIQQSYYGTKDYETHYWRANETLAYSEWHYNPVQAGDAQNGTSRIIDFEVKDNCVYVKAQPRDWATYDKDGNLQPSRYTECYVENWYTVSDTYIKVDNRMVDFSGYTHPITTQELPAFYTLSHFNDYYWYSGNSPWIGELTVEKGLPFWGDPSSLAETTFNYQKSNTETWAAFVNSDSGYGIGLYVPNADTFKGGIVNNEATDTNSSSSNTSYFAPLKELQIVCYEPIEYSYLICTGSVENIRSTFKSNKDFTTNSSLNNNSISKKLPDDPDMTTIDFSNKENLLFISSVNDALFSYDNEAGAVKFTTTATTTVDENKFVDSYFQIDYTMCQDIDVKAYPTSNYSYIEFEYMMPANQAGLQELYYQVDAVKDSNGAYTFNNVPDFVTLVADGEWHTAKFCISTEANWTGNILSLRVDFLNGGENAAGQEFYLRSFGLTNDEQSNQGYATKFDVGYAGNELMGQLNDNFWEAQNAISNLQICDGDFVRVTLGKGNKEDGTGEKYIGFNLGGETPVGQYMVIKYRTDAIPTSMSCQVFASTGTDKIGDIVSTVDCQGRAYGIVGDGKWHTLIIDLAVIAEGVITTGQKAQLNEVRIDLFDCFKEGAIVDIAYVGFCDQISDAAATLESGEYLEHGTREDWCMSVDWIQMDGVAVPSNAAERELGAAQTKAPVIEGSVWNFGGWLAINEPSITSLEYCITEEDGTENWISVKESRTAPNRWFPAEGGVVAVVTNKQYTNPSAARRLYLQADLREYVGQTVTISVRAITEDGYAVILYYVRAKVVLPEYSSLDFVYAADDLYNEMFGGIWDAIPDNSKVAKNADGSVSVTVTASDRNGKWIGFQPKTATATGNYMVIRYKTSATPTNRVFYMYNASDNTFVTNEENSMTAFGFVGNGEWHTLVIDLSKSDAVCISSDYKYHISDVRLQMLDRLEEGAVIDFAYIGFCNSLKDVPKRDGELIDYGWDEWTTSIDSVYVDGDKPENTSWATTSGIGPDHARDFTGTVLNINGWMGFNGQAIEELAVYVTNASGTEKKISLTKTGYNDGTVNRWYETSEITNHLTKPTPGTNYAIGTVGYRFNLSLDLSAFAGQTVTVSIRAIISEKQGHAVDVYRAQITVPGTFAPKWCTSIDAFLYDDNHDYITGGETTTISQVSTSSTAGTAMTAAADQRIENISATDVCWSGGWVAIDGHDISKMTCTVLNSNSEKLISKDIPLVSGADVVSYVETALGYVGSTPYRIDVSAPVIIDLTAYKGQTVTVVFSVTVDNTANAVDIIKLTVNVPSNY